MRVVLTQKTNMGIQASDVINASVDFSDTKIVISVGGLGYGGFSSGAFNGPHIYDYTNSIAPFTNVSIDSAATTYLGFGLDRITFNENKYLFS